MLFQFAGLRITGGTSLKLATETWMVTLDPTMVAPSRGLVIVIDGVAFPAGAAAVRRAPNRNIMENKQRDMQKGFTVTPPCIVEFGPMSSQVEMGGGFPIVIGLLLPAPPARHHGARPHGEQLGARWHAAAVRPCYRLRSSPLPHSSRGRS